jgi:hypothetical protein
MRRIAAFFSLALVCASASAESQYYVVLGSYATMTRAEEAQVQASERLPEAYGLVAADTPEGIYYRVVAGPYLGKERADTMLDRARSTGFADAWLLEEASPLSEDYLSSSYLALETLSTETDDVEDRLLTGDGAYDAPPPEPARRNTDGPSEEGDGGPILVEEAPPGYELHRLRRSGDS